MLALSGHQQEIQEYALYSFPYQWDVVQQQIPQEVPIESSRKYRDAAVWRLLCLEDRVEAGNLMAYWEIMDQMMEISIDSAIKLLENLYEYRARQLSPFEKRRQYPDVSNDLYRLEYDEEGESYRDVCAGTLINEVIDLLQTEAERLVRK